MRLFLAISLPGLASKALDDGLQVFKKDYPQAIWVDQKNFHITVFFFGDTNKLSAIKEKLERALYDSERFHLYVVSADMFSKNKITMYINFRREKKLERLVEKIKAVMPNQLVDNKKFIPHLTFGRTRIPSKQQYFVMKKKLLNIDINCSFPVTRVVLYESILSGPRPEYKKLASYKLL